MGKFLYQNAREEIIQMIENGCFRPGEKIMSERELSEKLKYNRMTIKKAIGSLVEEGILFKKKGSGTYLINIDHSDRFDIGDNSPISLTQGIKIKGMTSSSFVQSFKLVYDDPKLMNKFEQYFEFYELIRVRESNGDPFSIQRAYFPFRLFKDAHRYNFSEFSLYDYMEYKNKRPIHFKKKLYAKQVERDDRVLNQIVVLPNDKILCIEYLGYTEENELVEYTQSFFNSEKVNCSIKIKC